jgi:hypothetical protein
MKTTTLILTVCIATFTLAGCGRQCDGDSTILIDIVPRGDLGQDAAPDGSKPSGDAGAPEPVGKPPIYDCEPYCADLGSINSR